MKRNFAGLKKWWSIPFFILTVWLISMPHAQAACSAWRGKVFLNEYYAAVGGSNVQFLELYSADKNFATSTWQGWKIEVWESSSTKKTYNLGSSATNYECRIGGKTWVTRELTGSEDLEKNQGMVILRDGAGKAVDVLVFDNTIPPVPWPATGGTGGYYPNFDAPADCPQLGAALDSQRNTAVGPPAKPKPYNAFNMVVFQSNSNKNYARYPDGSGNWYSSDDTGSGTTKTTCSSNNTTIVKSTSTPIVSPGGTATWTVSLTNPDAAVSGISVTDTITRFTGDLTGAQTTPTGITSVSTSISPTTGCGSVTSAYNATTGSLTWSGITLNTGGTCTLTLNATVPSSIPENEVLLNTATTSIAGDVLVDTSEVLVKRLVAVDLRLDDPTATSGTQTFQDSSGAGRNGVAIGSAAMSSSGYVCRGAVVPNNTSASTIDAINTQYSVSTGLGGYGGIAFWYKSVDAWSGTSRMLFDASNGNNLFYMMKDSSGKLMFYVSDTAPQTYNVQTTAQAFVANTWVHIAAVWQLHDGTKPYLAIYVNGTLATSSTASSVGTDINANLQSLYIGDTRSTSVPSGAVGNSANGTFDMIKLFSGNVTSTEILAAKNATNPCLSKTGFPAATDCLTATADQGTTGNLWTVTINNANASSSAITVTDVITQDAGINLANVTATPAAGCGSTPTFSGTGGTWTLPSSPSVNCTLTIAGQVPASATVDKTYTNTVTALINNATQQASACFTVKAGSSAASNFNVVDGDYADKSYDTAATHNIYTKLAGTSPLTLDIIALKSGNLTQTAYVGAGLTKSVKLELIDDSEAGSPCNTNQAACAACTKTVVGTTNPVTFSNADQGYKNDVAITLNPDKAYQRLIARVTDASGSPTVYGCSSDAFTVRPQTLTVTAKTSGGVTMASGSNPAASPTVTAGSAFTIEANTATVGYAGMPSIDDTKVRDLISSTYESAVDLLSGSFSAADPATGLSTGTNFKYKEVGYFVLETDAVVDTTYVSSGTSNDHANGDCVSGSTSNVKTGGKYGCNIGSAATSWGRFIPSHFETAVVSVSGVPMSCISGLTCPLFYNGMVYSGQPFSMTVTAKNADGNTTRNYDATAGFAKATALTAWGALGTSTLPTEAGTLGKLSITAFDKGVLTEAAQNYTFNTPPRPPTSIYIRAIDTDSVSSLRTTNPTTTSIEGGVKVISGRVSIANTFGSELLDMTVPVTVQYYNASGAWVTNVSDNTSNSSSTTTWSISPTGSTSLSGSGTTTLALGGTVSSGQTSITASAPGSGSNGYVDVSILNLPSYLQYPASTNPTARISFGLYNQTGNSRRIIYRREVR